MTRPAAIIDQADALLWLARMRRRPEIGSVIADPPYSSGGLFRADRASPETAARKYVSHDAADAAPAFVGDSRDGRAYLRWTALWTAEALRVTDPGTTIAVFTDWRQLATTLDGIQAGGWIVRGVIPWDKVHTRPQLGRPTAQAEFVIWGSNGQLPSNRDAPVTEGAYHVTDDLPASWIESPPRGDMRWHPTAKPVGLLRAIARAMTERGRTILDPFAGSGSLAVAALAEHHPYHGCEITEAYAQIARHRAETEIPAPRQGRTKR